MPARSRHNKVRTGCATCRARKVKCDEWKPWCRMCLRSKRQCAGYTVEAVQVFVPQLLREKSPSPCLIDGVSGAGSPVMSTAFAFYLQRTIPQITTSYFWARDFWRYAVQMAQHDPAVHYLSQACALRHWDLDTGLTQFVGQSLAQCCKGLAKLRSVTLQEQPERLLICGGLLCLYNSLNLENPLCENVDHLSAGLSILDIVVKPNVRLEAIRISFEWAHLMRSTWCTPTLGFFGGDKVARTYHYPAVPSSFRDLEEACESFYDIFRSRFLHDSIDAQGRCVQDNVRFAALLHLTQRWRAAVSRYRQDIKRQDFGRLSVANQLLTEYRLLNMALHFSRQQHLPQRSAHRPLLVDLSNPEKVTMVFSKRTSFKVTPLEDRTRDLNDVTRLSILPGIRGTRLVQTLNRAWQARITRTSHEENQQWICLTWQRLERKKPQYPDI